MIKIRGFSLIESVLCLSLLAILILVCLPLGQEFYLKNQLERLENELGSAIRYARNQAIASDETLVLSPLAGSTDWSEGMILFVDNENHSYHSGDRILHQWQWQHARISWSGFYSNDYLLFSSNLKQAVLSGHFDLRVSKNLFSRLVINRLGRLHKVLENR